MTQIITGCSFGRRDSQGSALCMFSDIVVHALMIDGHQHEYELQTLAILRVMDSLHPYIGSFKAGKEGVLHLHLHRMNIHIAVHSEVTGCLDLWRGGL